MPFFDGKNERFGVWFLNDGFHPLLRIADMCHTWHEKVVSKLMAGVGITNIQKLNLALWLAHVTNIDDYEDDMFGLFEDASYLPLAYRQKTKYEKMTVYYPNENKKELTI